MEHHKRFEYCTTRPKYRRSRKLKAVKVYTIADESKHLLIFGVPVISVKSTGSLRLELKKQLKKFGDPTISCVTKEVSENIEIEQFTDVYHVNFPKLLEAKKCKKFLDTHVFYGGTLHISYAPEFESLEETREKIKLREKEVQERIKINQRSLDNSQGNKRKTIDELVAECVQNKRLKNR